MELSQGEGEEKQEEGAERRMEWVRARPGKRLVDMSWVRARPDKKKCGKHWVKADETG